MYDQLETSKKKMDKASHRKNCNNKKIHRNGKISEYFGLCCPNYICMASLGC